MGNGEGAVSAIPTRWIAQMEGQLDDARRRLEAADKHLAADQGGRALEQVYPGVMGAAMVKVWLADESWHRPRGLDELGRMVREQLTSGFATLQEMQERHQGFAGWRAEDARPLVEEARSFVAGVTAELAARRAAQAP